MKAVLLYGAETWRLADGAEAKVAGVYQQKLRHILLIFCGDWQDRAANQEEITEGTWRWLATH